MTSATPAPRNVPTNTNRNHVLTVDLTACRIKAPPKGHQDGDRQPTTYHRTLVGGMGIGPLAGDSGVSRTGWPETRRSADAGEKPQALCQSDRRPPPDGL